MKIVGEHDEVLNVKYVLCEACGKKMHEGMAYHCWYPLQNGTKTHVVKYMCTECLAKGRPVPGAKPQTGLSDKEVWEEVNKKRYIK